MKTNNHNGNNTQTMLEQLQEHRNQQIKNGFTACDLEPINAEIVTTLAQIATYKTLKFLMANNATTTTATETTDNGQKNTFGFDMSMKLLQTLPKDISTIKNAIVLRKGKKSETLTDAIDLVQVASETLVPFFCSEIVFDLSDTIHTKTLKNGNVRNYTAFSLACKSIREYITNQQQNRQYKKLAYVCGYTDNGTEVLTTKKPKDDITDIDTDTRTAFLNKYHLTATEQTAIAEMLNGNTTTATAEKMQVSKRTVERLIKSAKEKILAQDNRIAL